jgi:hypothetical protein
LHSAFERVIVSSVTPARTWALLAVSLVIGLAALLRMAGPPSGPDDLTGAIRLPALVSHAILALFTLAGVIVLVDLARRMRRLPRRGEPERDPEATAPPWLRTVKQILALVNLLVLAYLLWRGAIPLVDIGRGIGAAIATLPQDVPVSAPPLVNWTFGILGVVAGLAALALALSVVFGERLTEWWGDPAGDEPSPPPLEAAVEESLDDLRAEADPRRAIIRCYARFERAAAESGLARKPWLTPMEFMREVLERLPLTHGAVPTLTGLFELARFSRRALGAPERERALGALDEIKAAIDARKADVVAS